MLKRFFYCHFLTRLPQFLCLIVILFTASNILFAQKKSLPKGFPADCPLAQPLSKKEVNNSPARVGSDSLVKKAQTLLSCMDTI